MKKLRRFSPNNINYHLNKLFKGPSSLESISSRCIVVSPAQSQNSNPSIFLENELNKIKKLHPQTTWEIEERRIRGGTIEHAPSLCYELENVLLTSRDIYKKNFKKSFTDIASQKFYSTTFEVASSTPLALVSSNYGIKYFGHWLSDDCCTYQIAKDYGFPIAFESDDWPHKEHYAKYFNQNWNNYYFGHASKLLIFTDYAQNESKVYRYKHLRSMLRAKFVARNPGSRIYLKRGLTGNNIRNLVNESELINSLEQEGFITVDITSDSYIDMIEKLLDSDLIVTIEGSQHNHALYTLSENGTLINIQPPAMFNNVAKDWCSAMGFKHGFTVCEQTDEGFKVDINSLKRVIELTQN